MAMKRAQDTRTPGWHEFWTGARKSSSDALDQFGNQIDEQANITKQYTGNQGFNNALGMAQQGAGLVSNGIASQALGNARSAGMNKAQAADMAAQQGATGYQNAFTSQQQNAQNMANNAVAGAQSLTNAKLSKYEAETNEANSRMKRNAVGAGLESLGSLAGAIISAIGMSDERMKNYVEVGKKLESHRPYCKEDLIWKNKAETTPEVLDWSNLKIGGTK